MATRKPQPPQPARLASLTEAAERYKISTKTIRRRIAAGEITGYRIGPRIIRVDLDEIERVLLHRIPTTGSPEQHGELV